MCMLKGRDTEAGLAPLGNDTFNHAHRRCYVCPTSLGACMLHVYRHVHTIFRTGVVVQTPSVVLSRAPAPRRHFRGRCGLTTARLGATCSRCWRRRRGWSQLRNEQTFTVTLFKYRQVQWIYIFQYILLVFIVLNG